MHQIGKMAANVYGSIRANGGSRLRAGSAAAGVIASPFLIAGAAIGGMYGLAGYEPPHMHDAPTSIVRVFEDTRPSAGYEAGTTLVSYGCGHVEQTPIPSGLYEGRTAEQIAKEFANREIDPLGNLEERVVFR